MLAFAIKARIIPTIPAITNPAVILIINSLLVPEEVEDWVEIEGAEESIIHESPSRTVPGPHWLVDGFCDSGASITGASIKGASINRASINGD